MRAKSVKPLDLQNTDKLVLISKWDMDGSSSQAEYKQRNEQGPSKDSSIFTSSIVILKLIATDTVSGKERIIWENERPSSTRFCRPIKFKFVNETKEMIIAEKKHIDRQIQSLGPSKFVSDDKEHLVQHTLLFTMIDGKICNALTDTSSAMKCHICKLTSSAFNNFKVYDIPLSNCDYSMGISVLHTWIKSFEFFFTLIL